MDRSNVHRVLARMAEEDRVILPHLVEPEFHDYPADLDLVFIDAEKSDYLTHLQNIANKLVPGGVVVADNTISHRDELSGYLQHVRNHPDFVSIAVPIGKGLELTRKRLPIEHL